MLFVNYVCIQPTIQWFVKWRTDLRIGKYMEGYVLGNIKKRDDGLCDSVNVKSRKDNLKLMRCRIRKLIWSI